jgi:hypothetical protein
MPIPFFPARLKKPIFNYFLRIPQKGYLCSEPYEATLGPAGGSAGLDWGWFFPVP